VTCRWSRIGRPVSDALRAFFAHRPAVSTVTCRPTVSSLG